MVAKKEPHMGSTDFNTVPGMTKEVREELVATFDALSDWRDAVENANIRCLNKELDRTYAAARAMGWPDPAIASTREYLERAAKVQTEMIDQLMDGWKQQINSPSLPMAIPRSFNGSMPRLGSKTEFNPLAPWMLWWQAAEMWQRTWMPGAIARSDHRSH
jgi:hypothetical protein